MKACYVFFIATLTGAFLPFKVQAASDNDLLELINAYRADPPACKGAQKDPLPPLAPNETLAQLKFDGGGQLMKAMREAGYQAARAQVLTLSGPTNAQEAMRFAAKLNCRLLLSPQYSEAGISQQGQEWHIVLAKPQLDPNLGSWQEAGQEVLQRVNDARTKERTCGDKRYKPAPALSWNAKLGTASLKHSRDMAEHDFIGHRGSDGQMVKARVQDEGYRWRNLGENVAAGQSSPQQVVAGWLASPGHCANIMNSDFTQMGAAYATNPKSKATIYWTQVFGTPR